MLPSSQFKLGSVYAAKVSLSAERLGAGTEDEEEHTVLRKEGLHGHPAGGGPPKPLCRNFGQVPKLTGDWVDHPEPTYQGMYSQVTNLQMLSYLSMFACRCMRPQGTKSCFQLSGYWPALS